MTEFLAGVFLFVALSLGQTHGAYNVSLNVQTEWNSLANVLVQKMVDASVFDVQVAKNFLTTFGFSGTGSLVSLENSTAYTSSSFTNITFSANASGASDFSQSLSQLMSSVSMCTIEKQLGFIQALLKFALDSKVLDARAAVSISATYHIGITVDTINNGQECLQRQYEFKRYCISQYNGVADGFRCFFVTDTLTNWTQAWEACRSAGGKLAQVQASSERIVTFLPDYAWIAGARTKPVAMDCGQLSAATYWYEDVTTYEAQMPFSNTFIKTVPCSASSDIQRCATLHPNQNVVYQDCGAAKLRALCQISDDGQEFVRVKDVCVTETPVNVVPGSTYKDCIQECYKRRWCRSFNYINNNTCQLFSWMVVDNPKKTTGANAACTHYSYVASALPQ